MAIRNPIVVVEDSDLDAELLERSIRLKFPEYPFLRLKSSERFLDWLWCAGEYQGRDETIVPSMVVLDYKLPGVDGITILKFIRNGMRLHDIPVVLYSAWYEEEEVKRAYIAGVTNYIVKTGDLGPLLTAMRIILDHWQESQRNK